MTIMDKANEYIGHPREVDEGYEVSIRRDAWAQGYKDAIEKTCEWLVKNRNELSRLDTSGFVGLFIKAMEN